MRILGAVGTVDDAAIAGLLAELDQSGTIFPRKAACVWSLNCQANGDTTDGPPTPVDG